MLELIENCNWIKENVAIGMARNSDNVAFALGRLLVSADTPEKRKLVTSTLLTVSEILGTDGIQTLWNAMKFSDAHWNIMEDRTRESIITLKFWFLSTPAYFANISNQAILEQGGNTELCRVALIALLRKSTSGDLFNSFNYDVFKQSGPEQQMASIQLLISQCELPPIEHLCRLGTEPELANFILLDLASHPRIFEVGTAFAHKHPSLRGAIATTWCKYFQDYPLSDTQTEYLKKTLPELKYPEFSDLRMDTRYQRVFGRNIENSSLFYTFASYFKQLVYGIFEHGDTAANDCFELAANTHSILNRFISHKPLDPLATPTPERDEVQIVESKYKL